MAKDTSRPQRVADAIQRELSQFIQLEVSDPRIGMVSITEVEVARDLANAKVFVTFLDREQPADIESAVEALNRAAGFLRTLLAKSLNMRTTPRLQFRYDSSARQGQHLDSLISKAVAEDRARHQSDSEGQD